MKVLIHSLQSSGASLFAYFLSQTPRTIGIIDLNNHRLAPRIGSPYSIVLKCVITTTWTIQQHVESFGPDKTILFIRNPYNNYFSLRDKIYANRSGSLRDKFRLLEAAFSQRNEYDATIFYEDFLTDKAGTIAKVRSIGWPATEEYYDFRRTPADIFNFNNVFCRWCRENPAAAGPQGGWGMGNLSGNTIIPSLSDKPYDAAVVREVRELCPGLSEYYASVTR
jgi:hypothetical protein